ncbi:Outer membrane protein [Fimbriiglobus ruber]|uniref:Outer membrane protein n=1 Tax=Fimbriiglobus ruber TaxID=1908690 RepID=A0A225DJP1_9BACT|nr:Outer membrane protein [Fimbriiglobus ruber]
MAPDPPPATILQAGENPIDLETALRLAGVENPELLLARQRISEVTAQRQLAVAQILPNLNVGTNFDQHTGALQQSNGNILNVNRDALYFGMGANAVAAGTLQIPGLNYNLNVGEAWYGFLSSRQRERTAAAAAEATNNDVLLRVCLAYLDLLRGEGRRAIAKKNRDEAAQVERITRDFAETGQGRKADADRAAVDLRQRDAALSQAEAATLVASTRLCQLLNLDPSTRLKPIDGWAVPAPLVPDPIPLTELLAIALLQRPELAARRSEVRTALYDLSLSKILPFSPNVILGFSAGGFGGGSNLISTPPGFLNSNGQVFTDPRFGNFAARTDLDVAVFWTFRNMGVGNVALIRAADSRVRQSQFREMETLNLVRGQVAESHALVSAQYLQIDAGERAARSSQAAFSQDLERIRGGQGLPLEVLDSMRLLGRSRYEYLDAIIDYNRAQFQLWVALGRPPAGYLARPVPPEFVPPSGLPIPPGPRVLPPGALLPIATSVRPQS